MADKRNALAELAGRLGRVIIPHPKTRIYNDLLKAYRIVAELAKVSDGNWEVICDGSPAYFCTAGDLKVQCAIGRCREIAEEGDSR